MNLPKWDQRIARAQVLARDYSFATDILWFYLGREAWHVLVAERQWSWDTAEQWLTARASEALIEAPEDAASEGAEPLTAETRGV